MTIRVLLSARDPGGAGSVAALARRLAGGDLFEPVVAASGVALSMLRDAGVAVRPFSMADGRDHLEPGIDAEPLLRAARELMAEVRPRLVVVATSSFGVGVDEALLAVSEVPTLALQDFWGDVNLGLGRAAGLYLVLDPFAEALTRRRFGVDALAVGSPKHEAYAALEIPAMRQRMRREIELEEGERLLGWFGQSAELPGHERTFERLLEALAERRERPVLVLREHPKFPRLADAHLARARALGLRAIPATGRYGCEPWLAACDLVVTPYSLCGMDHAYLSRFSPRPLGTVLYLMIDRRMRSMMAEEIALERLPLIEQGLGEWLEDEQGLADALERGLDVDTISAYFACSKRLEGASLQRVEDILMRWAGLEIG